MRGCALGGAPLCGDSGLRRTAGITERREQRARHRVGERLVFGVPLHADNESRARQAHRLDEAVGRGRLDPEAWRRLVDMADRMQKDAAGKI